MRHKMLTSDCYLIGHRRQFHS